MAQDVREVNNKSYPNMIDAQNPFVNGLVLSFKGKLEPESHILNGKISSFLQVPSRMTLLSSRLELDLATMVFCHRFILNSQSQWYIHLRADSFPQGGRDYFICEYDYVKIGPTVCL